MDAEIAALWGAGIGGVLGAGGVLGSAWLAGRSEGRTQHAHWRRQGRREAYSAIIATVTAHRAAVDSLMKLMDEPHSPEDASRAMEHVNKLLPPVEAAVPVVAVEGPATVATLARNVMRDAVRITQAVEFYVAAAQRFDEPGQFEATRVVGMLVDLDSNLTKFTEEARDALDSQNV